MSAEGIPLQSGGGITLPTPSPSHILLDDESLPPTPDPAGLSSHNPAQQQPLLDFDFTPNTQMQPPQFGSGPINIIQFHEGEPTRKFKHSVFHKILLPSEETDDLQAVIVSLQELIKTEFSRLLQSIPGLKGWVGLHIEYGSFASEETVNMFLQTKARSMSNDWELDDYV